jgi:hypothetical protein
MVLFARLYKDAGQPNIKLDMLYELSFAHLSFLFRQLLPHSTRISTRIVLSTRQARVTVLITILSVAAEIRREQLPSTGRSISCYVNQLGRFRFFVVMRCVAY